MKKRRFNIKCMVIPLLGMALLTACGSSKESTQQDMTEVVEETQEQTGLGEDNRYTQTGNLPITDNDALYEQTKDDQVVTMYLTVQSGNASEGTNHTWTEINQYSVYDYESMGVDRYKVEGTLKVGNESGPVLGEFGYEAATPNVTVSIRGQSSSSNAQKNYKIRIRDGKGSYQNQKIINLNKHMSEGLRFRNKLCYDLMKDLPGMMSARTQFVHLYVKDMTKGGSGEYEDYGLYTQVEQINKTYLKMHGLDKNGQLYKVNFFEFQRYEDIIRLSQRNFVIAVINGNDIALYLFEEGKYVFSNRSRLFSERGSSSFTMEVSNILIKFKQFIKTADYNQNIERVYFCGLDDYEEKMLFEVVSDSVDIRAMRLANSNTIYYSGNSKEFVLHKYVYAIGSLCER